MKITSPEILVGSFTKTNKNTPHPQKNLYKKVSGRNGSSISETDLGVAIDSDLLPPLCPILGFPHLMITSAGLGSLPVR